MSWIQRAKVGDKIVCINGNGWCNDNGKEYVGPNANDVCEISKIHIYQDGDVGFQLEEFDVRGAYQADHFQPVRDTTLQVEALKRICLNTPETVA